MNSAIKKPNIALVGTGSPCREPEHPAITQSYLQARGLNASFGKDTFAKLPAKARAEIFLDYLKNDDIDVIWSIRGGEGTADLIPYLEAEHDTIAKLKPKLLVGYSDFTAMLFYFSQVYHWPCVHGAGAVLLPTKALDEASEASTLNWLFQNQKKIFFHEVTPLNQAAKEPDIIQAKAVAGCLSLMNISIREPWEINFKDKIVMIEDVNEKPHAVSRTLKYLQRIGIFNGAKAIIFGDFSIGCNQETEEALKRTFGWFASQTEVPVLLTKEFGHGRINKPIPFNQLATLNLGQHCSLQFE